ncbi:MAG: metallophosphoesterase [Polyangiaceae bacterium]
MVRRVLLLSSFFAAVVACGGGESAPPGDPAPAPTTPGTPAVPGTTPDPGSSSGAPAVDGGGPGPAGKTIRFAALGDTGTGSADQIRVANALDAKCKASGCDFIVLLGDNIYDSGVSSVDDPQWQSKFEVPYAAINLDFFAVLGNHDYGANGAGTDFPKGKNEIDYTAKSTKWKMPAAYYTQVKGPMELFALDTNKILFGQDSDQKKDMTAAFAASTAKWKIAVGHHPYRSNGPHGNAGSYDKVPIPPVNGSNVKSFMDDVVCGKADLYISGHDHSRQWLDVNCAGTSLAVSGAGAKATELKGSNPALFQSLDLGFLYITVDDKTLKAEWVDDNGKVESPVTLTK